MHFTYTHIRLIKHIYTSTFTEPLPSGAAFINTFMMKQSLSLTQTMSICNSTLSISFSFLEHARPNDCRLLRLNRYCLLILWQLLHQRLHRLLSNQAPTNSSKTVTTAAFAATAVIVIMSYLLLFL